MTVSISAVKISLNWADRLVHGNTAAKPGIILRKMTMVPTPDTNQNCPWMAIKLLYDNVEGELVAAGRPAGFALVNADGKKVPGIFKTTLEGSTATLHTDKTEEQLKSLGVSYGYGRHPYCNIADRDGMSLPAMQRVMLTLDGAE